MQSKTYKHPVLLSILLALIPIVCMSAAGTAIAITEADGEKATIIQTIAVALSAIIGVFLVKAIKCTYSDVGFCTLKSGSARAALFYIPMIAVELVQIVTTPIGALNVQSVIIFFIFTLLVGLNEELYFRGLILRVLGQIGIPKAIIISSVIFGAGHAATALSGASLQYVILQIIFAFLFGFVAAEAVVITGSLLPLIAWHFIHDFWGYLAGGIGDTVDGTAMVVLVIQIVILIITAILYWRKIVKQ
ncbi:hypothetical protein FACS1894151_04150 [Spirochaetia bacterium]|nr:hypothetical protein FACS1894151_04150 [Spirochaetia bacterium]